MDPSFNPLQLAGGSTGCLLVHGFTSCPADLRYLTEHLHTAGLTVHEVLLPGHGSTAEDMAKTDWQDWLVAVEQGLDNLSSQCSAVWLIGFSMGGVLTGILASRSNVQGYISISAPIWPRAKMTKFAFLLQYIRRYVQLGKRPDFELPSWRYQRVAVKNIADLTRLIKVFKGALPHIKVPTLVIQGEDDRTIEPRSADYIFRHLGSADKVRFSVPGGHMLLLGVQRQQICDKIYEFIKTRTGGIRDGSCKTGR